VSLLESICISALEHELRLRMKSVLFTVYKSLLYQNDELSAPSSLCTYRASGGSIGCVEAVGIVSYVEEVGGISCFFGVMISSLSIQPMRKVRLKHFLH